MIRLIGNRYVTAALVLLAVLAIYGAAALSRPSAATPAQGRTVPVAAAVLACPAPAGGRVGALTAPSGGKDGQGVLSRTKDGGAEGTIGATGTNWYKDVDEADGSFTLRAAGAFATGLEVEQTTVQAKGDDRGLANVRCDEPGIDHWFLGPGPADADDISVHLANVDDQPASVDLLALSGEGPLDTTDGRAIAVDPHSTKIIKVGSGAEGLGDIVANAQLLALRVRVGAGRVAAAVRVRAGEGKGVDWEPAAPAPARALVVPGVFGGGGGRSLLVAVPGEADARVRVQVISSNGAFAPQGQDLLLAPAGTVTPVDLGSALSGKPAAVRLTSDRPIVAGLMTERDSDVAYGTAAPPITIGAMGMVADNRLDATLVITAPQAAATVRVTPMTGSGPSAPPQDAKIGAGRTVEIKVTAPSGAAGGYGLMIGLLPGSGPVHVARLLSTKEQITLLPVVPALTTVRLPPVGDSQTALIP